MKWDWLWRGDMWAAAASPTREFPAIAPAPKRGSPSLLIRLAWPIVIGLAVYEKVPLWTVVLTWPLIESLRRVDVIAKTHFKVDVDEE
jgi:hypothetical protein